ncbi:MAG: hypothetical protein HYS17_00620 [Micavibrio aeruginosavorus]|uniref:Uncharacterized protein n=1 Tax=Micavibrio aeruginosavorus TaxID=349221 RepID=A0A7T5R2M5_9BACT|nr:MAG: hypothetical protein HYS17_00620 [Micavibrio aeruginosavorus]
MNDSSGFLRLYPNGALLFDPAAIGSFRWPNPATLPADINRELTIFQMGLIANSDSAPYNQVLRALYNLPGILAFNLSYHRLAILAERQHLPGFIRNPDKSLITIDGFDTEAPQKADFKDYLATYGQKLRLELLSVLGAGVQLTASAPGHYPREKFGVIRRLRRADAIPRVLRNGCDKSDKDGLGRLASLLMEEVGRLNLKYEIHLDSDTQDLLHRYVRLSLERGWQDLQAYIKFFNKSRISYFERSLTPRQSALIATACHANDGEAHSTYHGVCQSAGEPDIVTMANARHFWAPTPAFMEDAHALSPFIPEKLRHYDIRCYEDMTHHRRFIRNDKPRETIRNIAIIGRHVVMRQSAFNMLEFPFYLDLEKRLGILLADQGYQVTYKAHPESDWRHFSSYFDQRIKIDWRPFEAVMDEFDAVIYHFGASSTLPPALGSHQHLFMIKDGWHDRRVWPPRLTRFFEEYANMIPATIGENGLIQWDEKTVAGLFLQPKPVSPEERIRDFFCKRYE